MVCEDLICDDVTGHHAADDRRLNDWALSRAAAAARDVLQIGRHVLRTCFTEMPAQDPNQLLKVTDQRGMVIHLNPQILKHRHALRVCDGLYGPLHFRNGEACVGTVFSDGDGTEYLGDLCEARCVLRDPCLCVTLVLHQHGDHGRKQPSVGARLHAQVNVGHFCGFSDHGVDHDHGLGRIFTEVLQEGARSGYAVGVPRVLTEEKGNVAVVKVALHHGAKHLPIHPEFTGFLLSQGTGAVHTVKYRPCGAGIRAG